MKMKIDIKNIWINQTRQITDEVILKDKILQLEGLDCYVGTISSLHKKLFIMKLKSDDLSFTFQNRFAGVEVYITQDKRNPELYILLQDEKLTDVFAYFIEDVIVSLQDISDSTIALSIVKERINYWRLLFSKLSGDILSAEQQRGLFGELYLLNKLLDEVKGTNNHTVINGWHGPLALNQDFRFNNLALEVKVTKKNNPSIKITNEYQLDRSGLTDLFLFFIRINEFPGQNNTLCQLINKIRLKLQDNCLFEFNEKLKKAGVYPDFEDSDYNSVSYSIIAEIMYNINECFPSITKDSINNALFNISYEIDQRLCEDFKEDIDTVIRKTVNILI